MYQNSAPDGALYTHENWNDEAVKEVEIKGEQVDSDDLYCASKTLAERGKSFPCKTDRVLLIYPAAWTFFHEHKSTLSWDLTVLNVPWVNFYALRFASFRILIRGCRFG